MSRNQPQGWSVIRQTLAKEDKTMAKYNGYTSWNAWNVSLWINGDYNTYMTARNTVERLGYVRGLKELVRYWQGQKTPDGAIYNRTGIKQAIQDIL